MANGDIAAAAGYTTYPSSQAHSLGYDDINYTLDQVANEKARATAAEALLVLKTNIIISLTTPTEVDGALWFKPVS
jgi:hypothetical protein